MPHTEQYGVKFVGYSAQVIVRKYGREVTFATLDFVTGSTQLHADRGWVTVRESVNLASFVRRLPDLASRLQQVVQDEQEEQGGPGPATSVTLSCGENEVCVASGLDVDKFIRQITARLVKVQRVVEQAEKVGSGIKRRPYAEHLDGIEKTGLAQVEYHGFALYNGGRLVFCPDYRVVIVKPEGPGLFEVHSLH